MVVLLIAASVLLSLGAYGLASGAAALANPVHLRDLASSAPRIGIGVGLLWLGGWMAAMAMVGLHP